MRRHPLFVDWAQPQGIDDMVAIWLARDREAVGSLAFGRTAAAGPVGEATLATARLLVPHLQRATAISRLLDLAALKGATLAVYPDPQNPLIAVLIDSAHSFLQLFTSVVMFRLFMLISSPPANA